METSIILIALSVALWIAITLNNRNDKKAFYSRTFITLMMIIFWCFYFFIINGELGTHCTLAALVACCYGIAYRN